MSSNIAAWIVPTVIIVTDLLAFAMEKKMEKDIRQAADLRNMFDCYVFGIPQTLSEEVTDVLYEVAEGMALRYPKEYVLQTTHTGSDTPPGVKDWYNTNIEIPADTIPVFFLIKENKWWDRKMVRNKNAAYSSIALVVAISTIVSN